MNCLSTFLDEVHHGSPSLKSLECLKERLNDVLVVDKYIELSKNSKSPVCLFPTTNAYKEFSDQMLSALDTDLHKNTCVDEVDETSSSCK